jgi:RNA 2',3'-cyclic 3'-phosphodiesterase
VPRLFFALWPDDALRARIANLASDSVAQSGGRAVPHDNLHVTLSFLGQVPEQRVAAALAAAAAAAASCEPFELAFELVFDQLEAWRRAGVLCLTSAAPPAGLTALAAALHQRLTAAGFELEERAFKPHITLARDVRRKVAKQRSGPFFWPVREFVLAQSNMTKTGSEYTVLQRWPLVVERSPESR